MNKFQKNKIIILCFCIIVSFVFSGCTATQNVDTGTTSSQSSLESAQHQDPTSNTSNYKLTQMLILSRHHIRSPLSDSGTIANITPHEWFAWTSAPSELSLRGGVLETELGQYFKKYLVDKGFMEENWIPENGQVRFYANSMQRTIATSQYFASGMLPVANTQIEYKCDLNVMDPVFTPKFTFMNNAFRKQAMKEIESMGGDKGLAGIGESLSENYTLLENVLDFKNSKLAKDNNMTQFSRDDTEIILKLDHEPEMKGSLSWGNSASSALQLQYFEEPDTKLAAFGKDLTNEEWDQIAEINDVYIDTLYTAPSVSINLAHPLLQEMKNELTTPGRKFTFLCGHDSNISSVLAALKVSPYSLPNTICKNTPIGGKLVIEKWLGNDNKEYCSISLVYQTLDQLRNCSLLDLNVTPMKYPLELRDLKKNDDGFYLLKDVEKRFNDSINAYNNFALKKAS